MTNLIQSIHRLPKDAQDQVLSRAADMLVSLFPKQDVEPVYSVGFQRWMKLSSKKQFALYVKLNRRDVNGKLDIGAESYQEIIDLLQVKTAKEILSV